MTWLAAWAITKRFWPLAVIALILGYHWYAVGVARGEGRGEIRAKWVVSEAERTERFERGQDRAIVNYRLELGSGADLQPIEGLILARLLGEGNSLDATGRIPFDQAVAGPGGGS